MIGNPSFFPWLAAENFWCVTEASRPADVERLIQQGSKFERIIIGRETQFTNDHILRAGALLERTHFGTGLLVYFPKTESDSWQFKESVEFYYPGARVWEHDTNFGQLITAEVLGSSWRLLVG